MQEYKRERNSLEARVNDLIKRATYHDDHLRVVDSWWKQVSCTHTPGTVMWGGELVLM